MTPPGFTHYAGNYRGQPLACLQYYEVQVPGDPRVGDSPAEVQQAMAMLAAWIDPGLAVLDAGRELPRAVVSPPDRLLFVVAFAAIFFQRFLTVHPYANGNGHAARFGVWAILLRFGYWPKRFPIEPRPQQLTYAQAISAHRDGNPEPP